MYLLIVVGVVLVLATVCIIIAKTKDKVKKNGQHVRDFLIKSLIKKGDYNEN